MTECDEEFVLKNQQIKRWIGLIGISKDKVNKMTRETLCKIHCSVSKVWIIFFCLQFTFTKKWCVFLI